MGAQLRAPLKPPVHHSTIIQSERKYSFLSNEVIVQAQDARGRAAVVRLPVELHYILDLFNHHY